MDSIIKRSTLKKVTLTSLFFIFGLISSSAAIETVSEKNNADIPSLYGTVTVTIIGDGRVESVNGWNQAFTCPGACSGFANGLANIDALPNPGSRFVRWEGDYSGTSSFLQRDFFNGGTLTAVFETIPVSQGPVVTSSAIGSGYSENGSAISLNNQISISDSANITQVLISNRSGAAGTDGNDRITLNNPNGYSISVSSDNSQWTISGNGSASQATAALRSAMYNNTGRNPTFFGTNNGRGFNVSVTNSLNQTTNVDSGNYYTTGFASIINDAPTGVNRTTLNVSASSIATITNSNLQGLDVDDRGDGLIFTVNNTPNNGNLRLNGSTLNVNSTFNQSDIDNNRLSYQNTNGSATSDSFNFTLADGGESGASAVTGLTFSININAPLDTTAPRVTSITRQSPTSSPTNANSLTWEIQFSEDVNNVSNFDFELSGTTASVSTISATGSRYRVTASGGNLADLNGTVTLSFRNSQNINDDANNDLSYTTPTGTNDNFYVVVNDNTAPRVTSITRQNPTTSPTSANSLTWEIQFSEDVNNVTSSGSDFEISGTTASLSVNRINDDRYRVTASGGNLADLNGTVTLSFASNQNIDDDANNDLSNTTPTGTNDNFYVVVNDNTAPTVISVSVPANGTYGTGQNLDFTVNFDENVTVNTASGTPQISLVIGSTTRQAVYQSGSGTSALLFRYTIQAVDNDPDGITIGTLAANGGSLQDAAGNNANLTLNNVGNTTGIIIESCVKTAPYNESFDTTSTPNCWSRTQNVGDGWNFSTDAGYDISLLLDHTGNGGQYAWVDFTGTDVNVILTLPIIDVSTLTNPSLEFWYESHYAGTLNTFNILYVEVFDGTSWNISRTLQGNTPFGWEKIIVDLDGLAINDLIELRFRAESGGETLDFYNDLLIDDVAVVEKDNIAPSGYTATIDQDPINLSNQNNVGFSFAFAEAGSTYNYSFTGNNGGTPVTGSGTVTTATDQITGIDLSGLNDGTITLSATLTDGANNLGMAATDTAVKNTASNDDLANAATVIFNQSSTSRPYNFTAATVETGETFTIFNGNAISSNTTGSLWFKFIATTDRVLIRTDSDNVMNLAIQLVNATNVTPAYSDLSNYQGRYGNDLNGIAYEPWISEESLTIGETYFVQVHNIDGADTNFDLVLEEARSYIYAGGSWITALGNPDGINDPYASVAITSGSPTFSAASTLIGDLGTATNATLTVTDNSTLTVNGRLFTGSTAISIDAGTGSNLLFIDHGNDFLFGNGVSTGISNLHDVEVVNRLENSLGSSMNISGSFKSKNDIMNTAATTTFKHTTDGLGVLANDPQFPGRLMGAVTVENFVPERIGTEKRAFRFLGSPVTSSATIFNQWQEGGNSPAGFGTHITGVAGVVGSVDVSTGLDQSVSGNNSMFSYDASAAAWNAISSTNQSGDFLNTGVGYRLFVRGDRNVFLASNSSTSNTTLRSSGTLSMADQSDSYDVEGDQFVLISNPYQNAMSLEDLIDDSSNITDDIAYYWDPNLGGASGLGAYVTYTGFNNGGTGSGLPSSGNNNGFIQPGQAVFLIANAGANGAGNDMIVNFSKSQLNESGILRGAANRVNSVNNGNGDRITMNLYDTYSYDNGYSVTDAIMVKFSSQNSNAVGTGDFTKIYNTHESIAISQEATDYAIASREMPLTSEVLQLKHYNYGDADYTYVIEVDGLLGSNVFLYDNYLNTSTPLVSGSNVVAFSVDSAIAGSMDADRFQLRFEDVTLGIGEVNSEADFVMYPNPVSEGMINISMNAVAGENVAINIVDMAGKMVMELDATFDSSGNASLKIDGLSQGIYILNMETVSGKLSRKLIVE
jgi:predicted secreted protein